MRNRSAAEGSRELTAVAERSVAEVISAALEEHSTRLFEHLARIPESGDPETVHQARVACRRLRSILQSFATIFDPGWPAQLRTDLAALADDLGTVRDVEVLLLRLEARAAECEVDPKLAQRLLGSLRRERRQARGALRRRLAAADTRAGLDEVRRSAADPPLLPEPARSPAAEVLLPFVERSWHKLRRRVHQLPRHPSDSELHRTRISVKRSRTAVLAVVPLFGADAARTNSLLGTLQDALGEQHDAVVASLWLAPFTVGELSAAARPIRRAERQLARSGRTAWRQPWHAVERDEAWRWMDGRR